MQKVSCIIAAYNEHDRIGNVLKVVNDHPLLEEVIVVDDGSKDNTADVVLQFSNVRLIVQPKNHGKSFAVYTGLKNCKSDLVFFLDADLIGLTANDITNLIHPVTQGIADISISLRKNSPLLDRIIGIDYLSGERVFSKKIIQPYLEEIGKIHGFGLEVFLNRIIIKNRLRIKIVHWDGVISPYPSKKVGTWQGTKNFIGMLSDMFKTVSVFEILGQIISLLEQKV